MRIKLLLVPVVAAVSLLAGCALVNPGGTPTPVSNGVEAEEPDQILARATDALAGASSVRAAGTVGEGLLGMTVDLTYAGENVSGTANVLGVLATILKVGNDFYIKADISLFEQMLGPENQDSLNLFDDKWIKLDVSLVETFLPLPLGVADLVSTTAPLTKGEITTVGDTPAIALTDAGGAVLHVATMGEPYLLDITAEGDRSLTFSQFGEEVLIEAPPADQVLDPLGNLGLN